MTQYRMAQLRRVYQVIHERPDVSVEELQDIFVEYSPSGLAHCTAALVQRGSVFATRTVTGGGDVTLCYRAWKFEC